MWRSVAECGEREECVGVWQSGAIVTGCGGMWRGVAECGGVLSKQICQSL